MNLQHARVDTCWSLSTTIYACIFRKNAPFALYFNLFFSNNLEEKKNMNIVYHVKLVPSQGGSSEDSRNDEKLYL